MCDGCTVTTDEDELKRFFNNNLRFYSNFGAITGICSESKSNLQRVMYDTFGGDGWLKDTNASTMRIYKKQMVERLKDYTGNAIPITVRPRKKENVKLKSVLRTNINYLKRLGLSHRLPR